MRGARVVLHERQRGFMAQFFWGDGTVWTTRPHRSSSSSSEPPVGHSAWRRLHLKRPFSMTFWWSRTPSTMSDDDTFLFELSDGAGAQGTDERRYLQDIDNAHCPEIVKHLHNADEDFQPVDRMMVDDD